MQRSSNRHIGGKNMGQGRVYSARCRRRESKRVKPHFKIPILKCSRSHSTVSRSFRLRPMTAPLPDRRTPRDSSAQTSACRATAGPPVSTARSCFCRPVLRILLVCRRTQCFAVRRMALVAHGPGRRDPIFHAQLEKEIAFVKKEFAGDPKELDKYITATENTCLLCHGVTGKRQYTSISTKQRVGRSECNSIRNTPIRLAVIVPGEHADPKSGPRLSGLLVGFAIHHVIDLAYEIKRDLTDQWFKCSRDFRAVGDSRRQ